MGFNQLMDHINNNKVTSDGYWRFMDPKNIVEFVENMDFIFPNLIPVAVSAFGEVLCVEEDEDGIYVHCIDCPSNETNTICFGLDYLFQDLADEKFLTENFRFSLFKEARNKLGELTSSQCYGFTPLLQIGGSESLDTLSVCDWSVHLSMISQF